jgi:hypothetical protein
MWTYVAAVLGSAGTAFFTESARHSLPASITESNFVLLHAHPGSGRSVLLRGVTREGELHSPQDSAYGLLLPWQSLTR